MQATEIMYDDRPLKNMQFLCPVKQLMTTGRNLRLTFSLMAKTKETNGARREDTRVTYTTVQSVRNMDHMLTSATLERCETLRVTGMSDEVTCVVGIYPMEILLLRFWKVPGSSLDPETDYPE
jgi:hypothetical protein